MTSKSTSLETEKAAADLLARCGVSLEASPLRRLPNIPPWEKSLGKSALIHLARPYRLKNLKGLSLFILPTPPQAFYAFAIVDTSPGSGCGSPRSREGMAESGSIFITDFTFEADRSFAAEVIVHEILHELTMLRHPTHLPRGSILADHTADMGPQISVDQCRCLQSSPFLQP